MNELQSKPQQLQSRSLSWKPNPGPQTAFLASQAREILYGGSVGGGKSDAIISLPLRRIWHPKHRAIIMRRTRPELQETIDRTIQFYPEVVPGAVWREAESRWKFPSGAMVQMGYAEHEKDIYDFKSFEYDLICFDELTSFTEKMYLFMMLRNRTKARELPPQIRSGTNPGDIGHEWVYRRFIEHKTPFKIYEQSAFLEGKEYKTTKQFIPSRVWDNLALADPESYVAGILELSPEDVAAYLHGDWTKLAGAMFKQPVVIADNNELLDKEYIVTRSVDFGIDDPTCVLWSVFYPKLQIVDFVSELYLKEATLDGVVHHIKAREKEMGLNPYTFSVGSPEMVARQATSANSSQSISSMMEAMGIPVARGNTDRIAGWARMQNLIARGTFRFWPGGDGPWGVSNLARTLPKLQRNTGLGKDPNDIRPRQEDHAADSARYNVMAIYELAKSVVTPQQRNNEENRDMVFDKMMNALRNPKKGTWVPDLGNW